MSEAAYAAPDFVEPLDGWRVWRVVERNGDFLLGSVIKRTLWPTREPLVAGCLHRRPLFRRRRSAHAAPQPECECGIYATSLERVGQYLLDPLPLDAVARVLGRVALWGTVIDCERGYRASHGYPVEVYVPADATKLRAVDLDEIAERLRVYGVPVRALGGPGRDAAQLLTAGAF